MPRKEYAERNFSRLLKFGHEGSDVYLAFQNKGGASMVYVCGQKEGAEEFYGEIGDSLNEPRPASYLYFMGVAEKLRGTGVASRKIFLFDAVSRYAFGKPLRS